MSTETTARVLLTEQEAADYLHRLTGLKFTKQMVKERRLEGKIAGYRLDRRTVYKRADLDAFLERSLVPLGKGEAAVGTGGGA